MKASNGSKTIECTEKAFEVVYSHIGFKRVEEAEKPAADLLDMTEAQLQKVNKDEIIAFLKENEYDFDPKAPKDELIKIVLGEE
ncbi:hypothetical protein OTK50_15555 [Bacillus sp. NEAU-CP5]|mgnify:FL=1|uniref:hypothetical protein n=1 Tax=Bacillus TaxID=1386 RepID=UPI0006B02876|nr:MULTISPECIES: hypothetical protein [Bacillus]ANB83334.1 hypothetical protein A6R78_04750 [Bacillus velezensis]AWD86570.1 hypothetical protein BVQ_03425 [Bacillus velezensis]KAF6538662.1 hypothetical protein G9F75_07075 [Bacillus sp. EKM208B]KAF6688541.1 hypothetical protein G9362_20305 [Bacillus sp. EKM601B]KOS49329.1 hypothetical protein AN272_19070 [Bacillus amyloliquefaciens]